MRVPPKPASPLAAPVPCLILLLLLAASLSFGQTITVTVAGADPNNWDVGSFDVGDIAAAGSDFTSTQAGPNVDIDIAGFGTSWVDVTVSKDADETTSWNSTYTLWIQRVDDGTGSGAITWDTTAWVQITATPTRLFRVRRDRAGVTVHLELRNLVVAVGTTASTPSFLTTISYTAAR